MHYYTFSALIFFEGKIRDAYNIIYQNDKPSTVIEFKDYVKAFYAGAPDTYGAIVIVMWEKIDEETYNHIQKGFDKEASCN